MKVDRKPRLRRAIVLMVALAVSIATVPRSHACQCASQATESSPARECCCSQPKAAESTPTCCNTEETAGCCDPTNRDCDCPHCQGEQLQKLLALRQADGASVVAVGADLLLATVDYAHHDEWHTARLPERPPPDVLTGYCPELERLCRWLI